MRTLAPIFPDPEGAFLDHASIERAIDDAIGFVTVEQILDAEQRVQQTLAVPRAVAVFDLSLEVA